MDIVVMNATLAALLYLSDLPEDLLLTKMAYAIPDGDPQDQFETLLDQLIWCKYYPQFSEKIPV